MLSAVVSANETGWITKKQINNRVGDGTIDHRVPFVLLRHTSKITIFALFPRFFGTHSHIVVLLGLRATGAEV